MQLLSGDSLRLLAEIFVVGTEGVWIWWERRGRNDLQKKLERMEAAIEEGSSDGNGGGGHPAPYRIGCVDKVVEFQNDGSGTKVKAWEDITTEHTYDNLRIYVAQEVKAPGVELGRPRVEEITNPPPQITLERRAPIEVGEENVIRQEAYVVVRGRFAPDTGPIGFRFVQPFQNLFCVNRERAQEAYKDDQLQDEYTTVWARVPADRARLTVRFPPNHENVKPVPIVFIRQSESVHHKETERIDTEDCFRFTSREATLDVPNPIQGLAYAICWTPPS